MSVNGWTPVGPSCVFNGQLADGSGTAPVSGRVTCIVVHPDTPDIVYAGTATGGVWKTIDNGLHWESLGQDQITLSVGAMALDPTKPDRLYVATGEGNDAGEALPSCGILIYTPSEPVPWRLNGFAKMKGTSIRKIIVDARAGQPLNRLLVATDRGLLESTDDGATWNAMEVVPGLPGKTIADIAFDPGANPASAVLYAAVRGDNVYRKKGADPFTALGGPTGICHDSAKDRITLALCKNHPERVYALFGALGGKFLGVFVSSDHGDTWTTSPSKPWRLTIDLGQSNYNAALEAHPETVDTLFFGEIRLWRSTDGANSWELVSDSKGNAPGTHADQHAVVVSTKNNSRVWCGNDGGIWYSEDGGASFVHRNRGLQTFQFYCLAQHPDDPAILLAGAQDNGTVRCLGSPAWEKTFGGDGFFCAIDPVEKNRWYASYVFMSDGKVKAIQRSDDTGAPDSWSYKVSGIKDTFTTDAKPFYVPFVIDPNQNKVLFLGTNRLYRSDNYGDKWKPITDSGTGQAFTTGDTADLTITAIAVTPGASKVVFVGTHDGRVFQLIGQDDWNYQVVELTAGSPANWPGGVYISDLAAPPYQGASPQDNRVYVGLGSSHLTWDSIKDIPLGRIFLNFLDTSVNPKVRKWKPLNVPPKLDRNPGGQTFPHTSNPVNAIVLDPNDPTNLYIGCDSGVFRSLGGDTNWEDFTGTMPNVAIGDLQFHKSSKLLRAATMGRSVWEREIKTPDPDPAAPMADLYIRDTVVDVGRTPTGATADDPYNPGQTITDFSGADIKIDTPFLGIGGFQTVASTEDYTDGGKADYVAFPQFSSDNFRKKVISRVYVEVINRGPNKATGTKVRAFLAAKTVNGYPNLDLNFWTQDKYLTGKAGDFGLWTPIGDTADLGEVLPAEPKVARWDYEMPGDMPDTVGVLAIATSDNDPVNGSGLIVEQIVDANKHVALREAKVNMATGEIVLIVLAVLGVAAVAVGVGVYAAKKK